MEKYITISFINQNKLIQRGILLLGNSLSYIVYSPGEITTWYNHYKDSYTLKDSSRKECPKIPEFDNYLKILSDTTYTIFCDIDEYAFDNYYHISNNEFTSAYFKDKFGTELNGVCLSWLNVSDINQYSTIIYDGARLSLWSVNLDTSPKQPNTINEIRNYFISNIPELDKYIGYPKLDEVNKIEYLPLIKENQDKVVELSLVRDKNMLNYRFKKLFGRLEKDNLLKDLLRLTESVGDINSVKVLYNILDLIKFNNR